MVDIPIFKPLIEDDEIDAASASLRQGWLGMGSSVGAFEEALAREIDAAGRFVVATSTGHAALHLAMMLIDLKPGDEVITPSLNNVAGFQAILATGAQPVLCDVREDTLCIDVEKAATLVGPRTKAILLLDYQCSLADHDAVAALAAQYRLRVIHDAAHSLGSSYNGRKIGGFSDICMFSFDPVKTVTCIDGGALVVRTPQERDRLHEMRLIGMAQPSQQMYRNKRAPNGDVTRLGFRYHMANVHAAIGLVQLGKLQRISARRRSACVLYSQLLGGVPEVIAPLPDFGEVTPFLYYVRVPAEHRELLRDSLMAQGIETGIYWTPGHRFSLLENARRGVLEVTDRVGEEIISLPLSSSITDGEIRRIAGCIEQYFRRGRQAA